LSAKTTYCEAMLLLAQLAEVDGQTPGNNDLLVLTWGDGWEARINRSRVDVGAIPPFHAAVLRKGIPLAIINPFGGEVVPGAENEICASLEAELRSLHIVPVGSEVARG